MEHTIVMVKKDSPSELVVVNGVTACEYLYGCLVTLTTQNGANPSFETDIWDLYDLSPKKGWRDSDEVIPDGIMHLLEPIICNSCQPVDILNAEGKLACKALCDPETKELHFTFTPETKASGLLGNTEGFTAKYNGSTAQVTKKADGKWYLATGITDPSTMWQCSIALLRQRPSEGEEWLDILYLTIPGDQRPQILAGESMEVFIKRNLRGFLSRWLQTPDGVRANLEECCKDFNYGDVFNYLPIKHDGCKLDTVMDEDVPVAEAVGFSVNQDELLAPDDVDIDIINPDGTRTSIKGRIDFQDGSLTVLDDEGIASLEGMMASGPHGIYSIVSAADGSYKIRVP